VRDGPVYDTDRLDTTGNDTFPLWASSQTDLYFNATRQGSAPPQPTRTSVSLSAALPRNTTSSATRVVGCTVVGEDPQTKLLITIFAVSKIALDGAPPWRDFEYPILTKSCNAAGCISTVASNLDSASGPGLLLGAGYAPNLAAAGNRDVLFVRVQDSPKGLLQVLPVANTTQNVTESTYGLAGLVAPPSAVPGLTGWQTDAFGRMYITGEVNDGGYQSPPPFIAALDFSPTPAPDGAYATIAKVQRVAIYSAPYCIQSAIRPYNANFGDLTSAWLEPASGDLFVADVTCSSIYRVEASVLAPNCPSPGFCGYIHPGISFRSFDVNTGHSFGSVGKVRRRAMGWLRMDGWALPGLDDGCRIKGSERLIILHSHTLTALSHTD
jgi:hypothetical protein